ncbi:MAG TPA: TetR/AcrR family transcriptional regulator [Pseudonocardia sp.]|nr:TetR/AcrR family transcriptional regulator [Pseudonocardia sp.]
MPTATWFRLPPARRQAVLDAAEAEFGALGFSRGSLNVVARTAGVSKGSLFQYFTDKADLCTYLSETLSQRIRAVMEEEIAQQPWSADFFGALRNTCCYWMGYFASHPAERALASAINLERDPAASTPIRAAVNAHYIAVFRPLLLAARREGQLDQDADVEVLLALLMLWLPHLAIAPSQPGLDAVLGLHSDDPGEAAKVVERLIAALRTGFAPR